MGLDPKNCQAVLSYLPGYQWVNGTLRSTGSAIPPTFHMDKETGEIKAYVRPIFTHGPTVGLYISMKGLARAIAEGQT